MSARRRPLFTDVDGTLCFVSEVHGIRAVAGGPPRCPGDRVEIEDPQTGRRWAGWDVSTSSYEIFMAEQTRRLLNDLRAVFEIVLVTGGRPATVAKRRPVMDFADAVICENGGVILDQEMQPDRRWQELMAPQRRALPEVAAHLQADGWRLDADGRTSALRVRLRDNPTRTRDQFAALCRDIVLPVGLTKTMNLDNLDIILADAGKAAAVRFYLDRGALDAATSVGIGDDVNDIDFLAAVGTPFVLGNAYPALLQEAGRRGWAISQGRCVDGINEILQTLEQGRGRSQV